MGVFKKLKSLFPIPSDWMRVDEKKNFILRLEDAYRWVQMRCNVFDKRVLTAVKIPSGSYKTFDIKSAGRYLFIFDASIDELKTIAIVSANNSGTVHAIKLSTASYITFDLATTNVLKVTNSATTPAEVFIERLQ